jgi:hypothetical protein
MPHRYDVHIRGCRIVLGILLSWLLSLSGSPQSQVVWQRCYGGSDDDRANAMVATRDGGFAIAGMTRSDDGDVSGQHGWMDVWVMKLDSELNLDWQKCFGGTEIDEAFSLCQTIDGGYILACGTLSANGDVTANHGKEDLWILKLDILGNLQWQHTYGGTKDDRAVSVTQAEDGTYLVAGYILSDDGDVLFNHGNSDIWALNLDMQGDILWQKSLGGSDWDIPGVLVQTKDYGFLIAGHSYSGDGDVNCTIEGRKIWLTKVSHTWNLEWQRCIDGKSANTMIITADTGILVGGENSLGRGVIYRLFENGGIKWTTETEGPVYNITEMPDGNILATGQTYLTDSCREEMNILVTRVGMNGDILSSRRFGGSVSDWGRAVFREPDGSLLLAGATMSDDCDVDGNHNPFLYSDVWLFRLDDKIPVPPDPDPPAPIAVRQNPVNNEVTIESPDPVCLDLIGPTGILLATSYCDPGSHVTFNMQPYPPGIYLIRERTSGRVFKVIRD